MNVFWLNLTATTHVAADLNSVLTSMLTAFGTRFMPFAVVGYTATGAKATWLYASGQAVETSVTGTTNGSASGGVATDATCWVIDWAINDYYRGGHPRTYLAGLGTNMITSGRTVNTTSAASLATASNGFITDVNALTHGGISAVSLGTVRFASQNAWLSPPVFRAYQSASIRTVAGTQRRRLAA